MKPMRQLVIDIESFVVDAMLLSRNVLIIVRFVVDVLSKWITIVRKYLFRRC